MTQVAQTVVRGAAVVIDDRINEPDNALQAILKQLEDAQIPTVKMQALPTVDSLVHWRQFGLIVLDWELAYSGADEETPVPSGISVPSGLADDFRQRNYDFIAHLLEETALPVFVASNLDADSIIADLEGAFPRQQNVLKDRVKVFGKGELEVSLFEPVRTWIESRPALKALGAWKRAYVDAEIAAFHQFSRAEEDWVISAQRAAKADGASFDLTLRELLANNIVNRIGPLNIDLPDPSDDPLSDAAALRRVLHFSAVVPNGALDPRELGTGDMFVAGAADEPYQEIRILLTPECDLVRGSQTRFTYLPAVRNVSAQQNSAKRVERAGKPERLHLTSCLLTPDGAEYDIALKNWQSVWVEPPNTADGDDAGQADPILLWPDHRRIGRLLDPYLTHIQQNFALAMIRKGLPRLPDDFYEGWPSDS